MKCACAKCSNDVPKQYLFSRWCDECSEFTCADGKGVHPIDDGKEVWLRINRAAEATNALDAAVEKRRDNVWAMRCLARNVSRLSPHMSTWREVIGDDELDRLTANAIELLTGDERAEVATILRAALERHLRELET